LGATSTRSYPLSLALLSASLMGTMPSCCPSAEMSRTSLAVILSFTLVLSFFLSLPFLMGHLRYTTFWF